MQSEQCYRQWRKEGRGGGQVCHGWWEQRGAALAVSACWLAGSVGGGGGGGGWGRYHRCGLGCGRAVSCVPRAVRRAGGGGGARQTTVQSWAPGAGWRGMRRLWGVCRAVVGGCAVLPSRLLRGSGEEAERDLRGN